MPLYLRRRKKTLREEVLTKSKLQELESSDEDDTKSVSSKFSKSSEQTFNSSSLKGSLLRNKLDNPLFKSFFSKKSSAMSKVRNVSDVESDDDDEESFDLDERIEEQRLRSRSRFFRRPTLFRRNPRKLRNLRSSRLSSSSNSSEASSDSSNSRNSEKEVDILTKLENDNEEAETENSFLLYTQKGNPVRVQFFFDYLQITPVLNSKKSKSSTKSKTRVIYYEDLAMWTNNESCLRMVHIKNKHTALQERSEIKLFINKKNKNLNTKLLNDELKNRVAVLMAGKMNIEIDAARDILEQNANATEDEVNRVVQKIDRNGQKCIAQSYSRINVNENDDGSCYELLNV